MSKQELHEVVQRFIERRYEMIDSLVRLYGQETPRCWDYRDHIKLAQKYGFAYVKKVQQLHHRDANKAVIEFINITPYLLPLIKDHPGSISSLSPKQFEDLIANRVQAMGMGVQNVGHINQRDGGIDLIAWPLKGGVPYLVAIQVKHRSSDNKVDVSAVRALHHAVITGPFNIGMLVTNTKFTIDAQWAANQVPQLLKLRDFEDLKRWLFDDFVCASEWREVPKYIEVAPGIKVPMPKQLFLGHSAS